MSIRSTTTYKVAGKREPVKVKRLELDYFELHDECKLAGNCDAGSRGDDWHGGLDTQEKCLQTLRDGSDYQLEQSKKLLDKITDKLDLSGILKETQLDVVGSLPCVPAYLSGSPMCMRRSVEAEADHNANPCRVFMGLASSQSINAKDIAVRSAAILAFAQALSLARPVELYGVTASNVSGHGEACLLIRIGMAPVDLSALCALAHPGIQRGALYGLEEHLAGAPTHKNWLQWPESEAMAAGVEPGDVFFKSPHADDLETVKKDPIKWVQDQLIIALAGAGTAYTGERNDNA